MHVELSMAEKNEFTYHKIELYKSESLGSGSYGGVCKAKCDGLMCAAKIMHPTLFDLRDPGAPSYLKKFREECHLLSLARHPNVVQYLTTYRDPDTKLPVLLMELCDESLTAFLERSPGPLPYHIQLNICHDISLGLVYLHSNGLIHRDLTGNNILMIARSRAKITDFGMSKLATVNPRMTALTLCPGNALYMSPEALDEAKTYTAKLDVFSFGVLAIQIYTRQPPKPTDRLRSICKHPNKAGGDTEEDKEIKEIVPETERRRVHLALIPDTLALKTLALQCLKKEKHRPTSLELSERLNELKLSIQYTGNMKPEQQHECMSEANTGEIQEHEAQLTQLQTMIQKNARQLQAKDQIIETKERVLLECQQSVEKSEKELEQAQKQLQVSEQLLSHFEQSLRKSHETITELQQTISTNRRKSQHIELPDAVSGEQQSATTLQTPDPAASALGDISTMAWRKGMDAPQKMFRGAAVVHGDTAYLRPADSNKLYAYDIVHGKEQWSQLPDNNYWGYSLTVIDGLVTSVGGGYTNSLLSLTGEGKSKQWSDIFPPMPTARNLAACITTDKILVVAGGCQGNHDLDTVEVMTMKTKQWSTVPSLPNKCSLMSGVFWGNKIILAGGRVDSTPSESVFSCSLSDLIPRTSSTLRSKIRLRTHSWSKKVWKYISPLPTTHSTLVSLCGHLLAVGGTINEYESPTTNVYTYHPHIDSWNIVNQMTRERSSCFAVTLLSQCLIVVGGYHSQSTCTTTSVEIFE